MITQDRVITGFVTNTPGGGGVQYTSKTAFWQYIGLTKSPIVVKNLWLKLHQGSAGASQTGGEIGLYYTTSAPNGAGQTLLPLVVANLGDTTPAGPVMVQQTGGALNFTVPAGTYLWAGRRLQAGTMPSESAVFCDSGIGTAMTVTSAATFTSSLTFAGALVAANASVPGLYLALD